MCRILRRSGGVKMDKGGKLEGDQYLAEGKCPLARKEPTHAE
jgi:hypothetical protein